MPTTSRSEQASSTDDWSAFVTFLRLETKTSVGPKHFAMLAFLSIVGVATAFWLPTFPPTVHRLFERAFHLGDWAEIVLANNLTAVFVFAFWIGVFDVLKIMVVPREERFLDVLLSKPLTRRSYMLARLLPALARVVGIGLLSSAAHWTGMAVGGPFIRGTAFVGASSVTVGLAVLLVGLVNLLVMDARDVHSAVLIAFVPMIARVRPAMICLYRPDLYEGREWLRDCAVFPMNLVWFRRVVGRWGGVGGRPDAGGIGGARRNRGKPGVAAGRGLIDPRRRANQWRTGSLSNWKRRLTLSRRWIERIASANRLATLTTVQQEGSGSNR